MISVSCLIPAAGLGERFRKSKSGLLSKMDLPLGKTTLLERTLAPFLETSAVKEIILAVPKSKVSAIRKKTAVLSSAKPIKVVAGGKTRTDSVFSALKKVNAKLKWVIVHDGARPLFEPSQLEKFLEKLKTKKALIVAKPVVPTLKRAQGVRITETVCRENLWEAETPQGFCKSLLLDAYKNYFKNPFPATDEASLVQGMGEKVFLFKNSKTNLKVTTFSDYCIARKLLEEGGAIRTGIGYDVHALDAGRKLWLGGVSIPHDKGTVGHSDGDPVLHALSDAMLGALALGDIGEHFPDTSKKTKDMASSKILDAVYKMVQKKGYELINADINVILETPKLKKYKEKIRKRISGILKTKIDVIALKARTAEGFGPVGEGKAVVSQAVATLRRI